MPKPTSRQPRNSKHDETAYLLSSSENAQRLRESMADADRGNFIQVAFDPAGPDRPLRVVRLYKDHKPVD